MNSGRHQYQYTYVVIISLCEALLQVLQLMIVELDVHVFGDLDLGNIKRYRVATVGEENLTEDILEYLAGSLLDQRLRIC